MNQQPLINKIRSKHGFTLFYALILVSLLVALGLAIFNITFKQLVLTSGARNSAKAFYAADTGLECALFWDIKYTGISSPAFGFYGDSLASGIAGYWRLDDGTGSITARDWSGRANDGDLTNIGEDTGWIEGVVGDYALQFDGVDDFVEAASAPVTGSGDRTVIFWVNPSSTPGAGPGKHVVEWGEGGTGKRYSIKISPPDNRLRIEFNGASYTSTLTVPQGQWSMVTVVLDGTTVGDHTLYVNEAKDTGAVGATVINTGASNGMHIGHTYMNTLGDYDQRAFHGALDDVRVYNRALSESEIEAIYGGKSNIIFTDPVEANTPGVMCAETLITDPANGWSVATSTNQAYTTFDIELSNDRCATIEIDKNVATTTIVSRGYNTCNVDDPRRVERAIRAEY